MTTLVQVARLAGVSAATVSNVLRGRGKVGAPTRQRVLAAVETLAYRPNLMARALVEGKPSTLALIVSSIANPFYPEFALAVERAARKLGYFLLVCNTNDDPAQERAYLDAIGGSLAQGVIVMNADFVQIDALLALRQRGVPVVQHSGGMPGVRARLTLYEGYLLSLQLQPEAARLKLLAGINEARACRDVSLLIGYCVLATLEGRQNALPLEVAGLGYVNLLHIAVTLAAIPDAQQAASAAVGVEAEAAANSVEGAEGSDQMPPEASAGQGEAPGEADAAELAQAHERLRQARAESESAEDSFFPDGPFHVTLVIEEPEAHLHPQLQDRVMDLLRQHSKAPASGERCGARGGQRVFDQGACLLGAELCLYGLDCVGGRRGERLLVPPGSASVDVGQQRVADHLRHRIRRTPARAAQAQLRND